MAETRVRQPSRARARTEGTINPESVQSPPTVLNRPFSIVAFDWDGTAVVNRRADATIVRDQIERLLKLGVYVVVITGTNFGNVDRQLSASIHGPHKQRLFVCTNRGSEVYGFDAQSRPALLWKRVATPEEEQLLTEIAETVERSVEERTGLDVEIVYDRLNRRKIDVIPVPEWSDPPKSMIGDLLLAVESRLKGAGLAGGLREVFELTERISRDKGLTTARVTSDVKHVEVGLTDKADSIAWMMRDLADRQGIPPEDTLIVGDEFGPIAGFEGSDFKMFVPEAKGAVFVSVGREPNGVPEGVVHVGGGPARFGEILEAQIELRRRQATAKEHSSSEAPNGPHSNDQAGGSSHATARSRQAIAVEDNGWILVDEGFTPAREHEIESIFAIGSGYLGTRGSLGERMSLSTPATFVAGVFNRPDGSVPELVVAPDWTRLRIFVEGQELRLDRGEVLAHRRKLNFRRGTLEREWRHEDENGRITHLRFTRFASLADRHALVEILTVRPENYSGRVCVESTLDGTVTNRERVSHVAPITDGSLIPYTPQAAPQARVAWTSPEDRPLLVVRTSESGTVLAFAASTILRTEDVGTVEHSLVRGEACVGDRWEWDAGIGLTYRISKIVSVFTSRDGPDPARLALDHLSRLASRGETALLAEHSRAWAERWEHAGVTVEGDAQDRRALRFAVYHLITWANPEDERVSIGARGLTGESYKGHVFWDTELYMLPFYTFTDPPSARAMLMYRYHTLPGARRKARSMGYRGALYAWESTDTGDETTPTSAIDPNGQVVKILTGEQEHHISADVAYAVWQYWHAVGDDDFFLEAGAEIMMDTARFWASRVTYGEDGLYHVLRVIGPDEYHEGVDDNAFTNWMAKWNLEKGAETARALQARWPEHWSVLAERLQLGAEEVEEWLRIAGAMYSGFDPATGLFEQHKGFFDLEYVDLSAYEPRLAPMDLLLGYERIRHTQVVKQADVVMLIYLFWDQFSPEVREANFRYYEPRTGHGSSLSPSIHAAYAARLGDSALAERYFRQAGEIDLANNMGNAAGGVHAAGAGGLWQAAVLGFGGMQPQGEPLTFDPHLPENWQSLTFAVHWQGRRLRVSSRRSPRTTQVEVVSGDRLAVRIGALDGATVSVDGGGRARARWTAKGWRTDEEDGR